MLPLDDGQADPPHAEHAGEMAVQKRAVLPSRASRRAIGLSARAATWAGVSPFGHPLAKIFHPGRSLTISVERRPS